MNLAARYVIQHKDTLTNGVNTFLSSGLILFNLG